MRHEDSTPEMISGLDFCNQQLRNADFAGRNLEGANFSGANLNGANFDNAILDGANFSGAVLSDGSYWSCNAASFVGASLRNAILDGTDLSYVDFTRADLTGARALHVEWDVAVLEGATVAVLSTESGLLEGLLVEQQLRHRLHSLDQELEVCSTSHGWSSDEAIEILERLGELWSTSDLYEVYETLDHIYGDLVARLTERFGADHPRTMKALALHADAFSLWASSGPEGYEMAEEALRWSLANPGFLNEFGLCEVLLRTSEAQIERLIHDQWSRDNGFECEFDLDELDAHLEMVRGHLNLVEETLVGLSGEALPPECEVTDCLRQIKTLRERSEGFR
jgi:hypothetical protein